MNNTSTILFFETWREKLLFPGDAQIENWMYGRVCEAATKGVTHSCVHLSSFICLPRGVKFEQLSILMFINSHFLNTLQGYY
jgi:hypothetical protein